MKTNTIYETWVPGKWITLLSFCTIIFSMNSVFAQSTVTGLRFNGQKPKLY